MLLSLLFVYYAIYSTVFFLYSMMFKIDWFIGFTSENFIKTITKKLTKSLC